MSDESPESVPAAVAFGMAVGVVFLLSLVALLGLLWLAGEGVSVVLETPILKGLAIGVFGTLFLLTLLTTAFYEGGESE